MSFRRRITLVAAAAVAVAVVLASLLTYFLTSNQLHRQVDSQLRNRGRSAGRLLTLVGSAGHSPAISNNAPGGALTSTPLGLALRRLTAPSHGAGASGAHGGVVALGAGNLFGDLPAGPDQVRGYQQVIAASGAILVRSASNVSLPVDAATRRLARSGGVPIFSDARVHGVDLRVFAEPFGAGRAIQFAQPLTEVDSLLSRLRLILALLGVGGIAIAALLGRLVAGTAMLPLKRLTQATEHVAETQDLSGRIEPVGHDEIGRLARSFNAMLDALEQSMGELDASVHAQRQLVADASHELRTPVTSLRTNIEILQQVENMDPDERQRLLSEVVAQIEELTLLMNDLIALARGDEPAANPEYLRLDLLVGEVVERARRNAPATPLEVELEPAIICGVPARLERAVGNLIDNAVKHSPAGEPVEITLRGEELSVRDRGPGISAEDLPHIFDRFYRGAEARGRPGSGLGLAIVRQVVTQQGGTVSAESCNGGGTLMRITLPGIETLAASASDAQPAAAPPSLSDRSPV